MTSLSLLVLMVWGCWKGRAPWILSSLPEALRAAELSFTLKIFSGIVLSSASFLISISICSFSFLVLACSPLLPCPSPVLAWVCLLSLSWCTWDPTPGFYGVFRISWSRESWKSMSPFSHPLPCFSAPQGFAPDHSLSPFWGDWWAELGAQGGILPSLAGSCSRWCGCGQFRRQSVECDALPLKMEA